MKKLTNKKEIEKWLVNFIDTSDYTIHDDLSITVNGSVMLDSNIEGEKLPVNFRNVHGNFNCSYNNLTTLQGCPKNLYGDLLCSHNKLKNFDGAPSIVIGHIFAEKNNITSLYGVSKKIMDDLNLSFNPIQELKLDELPKEIGGSLVFQHRKLKLLDFPEISLIDETHLSLKYIIKKLEHKELLVSMVENQDMILSVVKQKRKI